MDLLKAQLTLLKIWLIALIPIVILTLTRTFGNSGSQMTDVWKTVSPAIIPSLGTIIGTFAATQFADNATKQVNVTFYKITLWVSVVYLGVFLTMYAIYPMISPGDGKTTLDLLESFTRFLQVLDVTVVSGCLAVFFTSKKKGPTTPTAGVAAATLPTNSPAPAADTAKESEVTN
jgi:cytochrome bd-type quinol oxidase subunit 2